MRLALVLMILLLNASSAAHAAAEVTNVPFPPAAQACLDHMPSASNNPDKFLRCLDILEVDAADRWKAMYQAQHPAAKVCRDNPRSPSDPSLTSLCVTLIDQEDTAVAHHNDTLRVTMDQLRKRVIGRAATKAARTQLPQDKLPSVEETELEIERLDSEIDMLERNAMPPRVGGPVMSPPISCTSSRTGSFTYTDCY